MHILPFLMAVALLAFAGCRRITESPEAEEFGTLMLQISAGSTGTKAGSSKVEEFHNVLVVVVDKAGNVVDKSYAETATPESQHNVWFTGLKVGYYQVYAYANIDEEAWQTASNGEGTAGTVAQVENQLKTSKDASGQWNLPLNPDRLLKTLLGTDTPSDPTDDGNPDDTDYMLLSGQDELYVGVRTYIGQVDLYPAVVRLNVIVDNHTTDYKVKLTDLSFNAFNPSDSYLLAHWSDDGDPELPTGNSYRPLPALSNAEINPGERKTIYSKLLYENCLGQDYRMFSTMHLLDKNTGDPILDGNNNLREMVLTSQSVRRIPYQEIANLGAGEEHALRVLAVTPNTSNGAFIGFSSGLNYSTATFNFEEGYRNKAEDLLKDKQTHEYFELLLYKDNQNRYHLKRPAIQSTSYNYQEKDLFEKIENTTTNGLLLQEITALPASNQYPISSEFAGSLCRFVQSDNTNNSLFFSNALKLNSSDSNYGNRMWAFYEIHPVGSVLKFVDKNTSQVTTLTHMLRGQELTAVINVYYENADDMFKFDVDNVYWDQGKHESSHIFK